MEKRLHRSLTDKKIAGVCAGLAEYLGWDSTLVRLLWIILTLLGGSGVLIYIVLWIVMPEGA
jgi:phage shock protein PspC (stress-responsive transcriptional regulator)